MDRPRARRVVVLTGAGISTDSGIPDFRGPQGVWTKNPVAEKLSDIRYYVADREVRKASWQSRLDHPAFRAQPNAGHLALVALERRGKLHALITQNIDGLHLKAGNSPEPGGRGARQRAQGDLPVVRAQGADAGDAGPRARGRGRPRVPGVRRDAEERHDFLRAGAGARGHRPRADGGAGSGPAARGGQHAAGLPGGGRGSHREADAARASSS